MRLPCPDSVGPFGSSQSQSDSLEASGRDPNRALPAFLPSAALCWPGPEGHAFCPVQPLGVISLQAALGPEALGLKVDGCLHPYSVPGCRPRDVTPRRAGARDPWLPGVKPTQQNPTPSAEGGSSLPRATPVGRPVPLPPYPSLHPVEKAWGAGFLQLTCEPNPHFQCPENPILLTESEMSGVGAMTEELSRWGKCSHDPCPPPVSRAAAGDLRLTPRR